MILGMGSFRLGSAFGVREEQGQMRRTNVTEMGGGGAADRAEGGETDLRQRNRGGRGRGQEIQGSPAEKRTYRCLVQVPGGGKVRGHT